MTSSIFNMMGRLSNRTIALRGISFQHAPPNDLEPYLDAFGVMPLFGQEGTFMRLDAEVLSYPVLYSDVRLLELFDNMARQTMEQLARKESFGQTRRLGRRYRLCASLLGA